MSFVTDRSDRAGTHSSGSPEMVFAVRETLPEGTNQMSSGLPACNTRGGREGL